MLTTRNLYKTGKILKGISMGTKIFDLRTTLGEPTETVGDH